MISAAANQLPKNKKTKKLKIKNPYKLVNYYLLIDNFYQIVNTHSMTIISDTKVLAHAVTRTTTVDDSGDFPKLKKEIVMTSEDKARLLKERGVLLNLRGQELIEKAIEVALDDTHGGQMAAMKLLVERLLPMSAFDEAKNSTNRPHISINITGLNDIAVTDRTVHAADKNIEDADIIETISGDEGLL